MIDSQFVVLILAVMLPVLMAVAFRLGRLSRRRDPALEISPVTRQHIDLANGLRSLHREQSLPQLLRCAESAGDIPLGHFFAAETVCFLTFAGYLRELETPLGQAALRVLHRAMEGLRHGVHPHVLAEA